MKISIKMTTILFWNSFYSNRPLPRSKNSRFQNETKCKGLTGMDRKNCCSTYHAQFLCCDRYKIMKLCWLMTLMQDLFLNWQWSWKRWKTNIRYDLNKKRPGQFWVSLSCPPSNFFTCISCKPRLVYRRGSLIGSVFKTFSLCFVGSQLRALAIPVSYN